MGDDLLMGNVYVHACTLNGAEPLLVIDNVDDDSECNDDDDDDDVDDDGDDDSDDDGANVW